MTAFKDRIESLESYIESSRKDLVLYRTMETVFQKMPLDGVSVYCSRHSASAYVNFYPDSEASSSKDLTKLVHALARKFHVKFVKSKSYDGETLEYRADVKFGVTDISIRVDGVVPAKCTIKETVHELTEEELEQARREALEKVKTTRIERTIVCR